MATVQQLNERIQHEARFIHAIVTQMRRTLVGQDRLVNRLLIALLSDGHVLIEGVPGLAKTLAVRTLAMTMNIQFQRIQFTPDLLPSDLVGTQIFDPSTGVFQPRLGPLYSNFVLADEINRAPAKVQSALLEAMEERQITIAEKTYPIPSPFMVLATQNPIDQEGTYRLPEAQLDRFMLKIHVDYPTREEERQIIDLMSSRSHPMPEPIVDANVILQAKEVVEGIYVDDKIKDYVLDLVFATRDPAQAGIPELQDDIKLGASPRATLNLIRAAKANAFIRGRGYVTPDDVKHVLFDVVCHRLALTFLSDKTPQQIMRVIAGRIQVP